MGGGSVSPTRYDGCSLRCVKECGFLDVELSLFIEKACGEKVPAEERDKWKALLIGMGCFMESQITELQEQEWNSLLLGLRAVLRPLRRSTFELHILLRVFPLCFHGDTSCPV